VCHVSGFRSTRQFSGLFFCPSRASSQCFSQASGASRSQHRLSSFLLTKYLSRGCNAVGCANTNGHRPTNTRSSFSAPEGVLSEVEQRFDCVQAQTHLLSGFGGGLRIQENGRTPRFLGSSLDSRVRSTQFLRRLADRQAERPPFLENRSQHP
jgi:hypothetical protein